MDLDIKSSLLYILTYFCMEAAIASQTLHMIGQDVSEIFGSKDNILNYKHVSCYFGDPLLDKSKYEMVYTWNNLTGEDKLIVGPKFKNHIDKQRITPTDRKFFLRIQKVQLRHAGKYFCNYTAETVNGTEERTVHVIQIKHAFDVRKCTGGRNVEFECTFFDLEDKPQELLIFYIDPENKTYLQEHPRYINITEKSGFYNISVKMIAPIARFANGAVLCDVIFEGEKYQLNVTKQVKSFGRINKECFRNPEVEKQNIWEEAGEENVNLRCMVDVPFKDNITSIEWIYENISVSLSLFTLEPNTNMSSVEPDAELSDFSSTMTQDSRRVVTTLRIEKAKLEHSGNYTCRAKFQNFASDQWDTAVLVVYQITKPYFVKATRCSGRTVGLECKVRNIHPKPLEMVFYVNKPDRNRNYWLNVDPTYVNITKMDEIHYEGFARMISRDDLFKLLPSNVAACGVKIKTHSGIVERMNYTILANPGNIDNRSSECTPNLRIDNPEVWEKEGKEDVVIRCTFDVPFRENVTLVEWIHETDSTSRTLFTWKENTKKEEFKPSQISAISLIIKNNTEGRSITTVIIKESKVELSGNYTCRVNFTKYGEQSATAVFVVYQITKPLYFKASQCPDQQHIGVECKAAHLHPKPEIIFYVHNTTLKSRLNNERYIKVIKSDLLYNISAKMLIPMNQLENVTSSQMECEVVIKEPHFKETSLTNITDPGHSTSGESECTPNLQMNRSVVWGNVGKEDLALRCTFDIPFRDKISSVEWIYQNLSMSAKLFTWKRNTNRTKMESDQITDMSFVITKDSDGRSVADIKFKKAKLEHSGNYTCRVNFTKYSDQSATAVLVIYEISKPFYFKASRCLDQQNIGMECKAANLHPKPEEIVFNVYYSTYKIRLNNEIYIKIMQSDLLYNISAKMLVPSNQLEHVRGSRVECEVIVKGPHIKDRLLAKIPGHYDTESNESECTPNVQMDRYEVWENVGKEDVSLRCTFDIPFRDKISSVEWIYQNLSVARILFTWKADSNKTEKNTYEITDMSTFITKDSDGRSVAYLKFKKTKVEHSGNYTCRVNFEKYSAQSATAIIIIYQILKPFTLKVYRCFHQEYFGIECKAANLHPKPEKMVFYLHYSTHKLRLDNEMYIKVFQNDLLYNISAKMLVTKDKLELVRVSQVECEVVVKEPNFKDTLLTIMPRREVAEIGEMECPPNLRMDRSVIWESVGKEDLSLRCTFDVPFGDKISLVEWIYQNFFMSRTLFTWKGNSNKTEMESDRITDISSVITKDFDGRSCTKVKFKKAKVEYSGNYTCRVKFTNYSDQSATAVLVIYQISNPYYFKVSRCNKQNVGLECKADNLYPKPVKMLFYSYNPSRKSEKLLDHEMYINIRERNGFYEINSKMIAPYGDFRKILNLQFACKILIPAPNITLLRLSNLTGLDESTSDECIPNLRMDEPEMWRKVGMEDLALRCTFDIPFADKVTSVQWVYQNFSMFRTLFTWIENTNKTQTESDKNKDMSFLMTNEHEGRNVTIVMLKKAKLEDSGNYTCQVNFSKYAQQSAIAVLVIYQIEAHLFTVIGCSDRKVQLECKAENIYPKPLDIVFSLYDPKSDSKVILKNKASSEIGEVQNGFYNISAEMITPIDQLSLDVSPNVTCDVVLNWDPEVLETVWTKRTTYVNDKRSLRNIKDRCSPKLEGDTPQWVEVGKGPALIRCKFHLPLIDEIESIKWFHHNFSMYKPIYKWKADESAITVESEYIAEILEPLLIVPREYQDRNATTLKFQKAKVEYSGIYSCQVNFLVVGRHSATIFLNVYQIEEPYHFQAVLKRDGYLELECKVGKLYPIPLNLLFTLYDNATEEQFNNFSVSSPTITKLNNFYNLTGKISVPINDLRNIEDAQISCDVILSHTPLTMKRSLRTRRFEGSFGSTTNLCSPTLEIEMQHIWEEVGSGPVIIMCRFDLPSENDEVESVEWFHDKFSTEQPFCKWEADGNRLTIGPKYESEILGPSLLVPQDYKTSKVTILQLRNAKLEHSGNYSCQANFPEYVSQSDTVDLTVYKIKKPYFFRGYRLNDGKILLECKDANLFPEPKKTVFSMIDPNTGIKSTLEYKQTTKIAESNGLYSISANMTIPNHQLENFTNPQFACDIILSLTPEIMETRLISSVDVVDQSITSKSHSLYLDIGAIVVLQASLVFAMILA